MNFDKISDKGQKTIKNYVFTTVWALYLIVKTLTTPVILSRRFNVNVVPKLVDVPPQSFYNTLALSIDYTVIFKWPKTADPLQRYLFDNNGQRFCENQRRSCAPQIHNHVPLRPFSTLGAHTGETKLLI